MLRRALDETVANFHFAGRTLRRSPAFSVASILTLGLCLGANTAILSIVDSTLLRPLPFPDPDRLAIITNQASNQNEDLGKTAQDGRTWEALTQNAGFLKLGVISPFAQGVNMKTGAQPVFVLQQRVSEGFFLALGMQPLVGRTFISEEDQKGGPAVAVLSHDLWQRAFQGAREIIGSSVTLKGEPHTVVGVMPSNFYSGVNADLWTPLKPSAGGEGGGANYEVIARLPSDLSWSEARSRLQALSDSLLGHLPPLEGAFRQVGLEPLRRSLTQQLRKPLLILWVAVALVLLIACMNLSGLILARATSRTGEIATRRALGASRGAVIRQTLAESLFLASLGGALGAILGAFGSYALRAVASDMAQLPRELVLDARYLAGAVLLSLSATALFGLIPALRISAVNPAVAQAGMASRGTTDRQHLWLRRFLVLGEVALGMVLLVSAGLLLRTIDYLGQLRAGFEPKGLVSATVSLEEERYFDTEAVNRLFERSLEHINSIPGVTGVAVGLGLPYERWLNLDFRPLDGTTPANHKELTDFSYVTPDYFDVLRIPLLHGRAFTSADRPAAEAVAVVSKSFVSRYFPGRDVIGSRLSLSGSERLIVGVVGDVPRIPGWGTEVPLASQPAVFVPAAQVPDQFLRVVHRWFSPSWVLRLEGGKEGIAEQVEQAIRTVDPDLPLARFQSLRRVRNEALSRQRLLAALVGGLAALALALAAVGIYGLIAGSVEERRRELGIRLALGATPYQAAGTVIVPVLLVVFGGIAMGTALTLVGIKALKTMIWGISPTDPSTYAVVGAILFLVALASSLVPTLQVIRLNPSLALRRN